MKFFSNHKKIFVWIFVILCVFLMIFSVGSKYSPGFARNVLAYVVIAPEKAISSVGHFFSNKKNEVVGISQLNSQVEQLKRENSNLTLELSRLQLLEKENQRLTDLLGTSESFPNYNKVTASIVAKDPSNWYNSFIIDKGSKDGLKENNVVIAVGGLVGKVIQTSDHYSRVVSIIDDTSSVSGIVTRNDSLGFVKGDSTLLKSGLVKMEYFDVNSSVMVGDEITTSSLSGIYPKGIQIGYVRKVETDPSGLSKYAILTPYVDFRDLDTVLIITDDFSKDLSEFDQK